MQKTDTTTTTDPARALAICVKPLDDRLRAANDLWRNVLNAGSPRDRINHLRAHVAAINEFLAEVERQLDTTTE